MATYFNYFTNAKKTATKKVVAKKSATKKRVNNMKKETILEIPLIDNLEENIFNNIIEKTELLDKYKIQCDLKNDLNSIFISYKNMSQIGKFLYEKEILVKIAPTKKVAKKVAAKKVAPKKTTSSKDYTRDNIPSIKMDNIINENYESKEYNNYLALSESYRYMINHLIKYILSEYDKVKKQNDEKIKKEEMKFNNIISEYSNKCEAKINEIKEIIKDFDYSSKNTYEALCLDLENDFENIKNDKNIEKVNNLIDEINKTYRNAYYRKNNVSSLSYMETEENDNLDLIKKIDINNLE